MQIRDIGYGEYGRNALIGTYLRRAIQVTRPVDAVLKVGSDLGPSLREYVCMCLRPGSWPGHITQSRVEVCRCGRIDELRVGNNFFGIFCREFYSK